MFPYDNFEIYKKAYLDNRIIYQLLKRKISLDFYLKNQFGKASLSMMLNLAEGSSKVGTRDRRNFIVIARGSTFECDH